MPADSVTPHPFQNPDLSPETRIDNLLSLMTIEEKIDCLGTYPKVPRLGVEGTGHSEGIHGLTRGGPGGWGRDNPIPTTVFPQGIGLGETWDPEILTEAAALEGYEARYIAQSPKYQRSGLVIRTPNADIGRDPRWGRTEECYGEDPYLCGVLVQAFVRGIQGDHPTYWQAAALMKHFLANSNEEGREHTSSDFDERLFREYYSVAFRMGVEAGSRAYMAAYNAYNGIPCEVHPVLKDVTVEEWGNDGIICTDGGAMKLLVNAHKYVADFPTACARIVQAGIGQFLDQYKEPTTEAVEKGLLTETEIDAALRGNFRVMIRLGLLDPPERVPYASIGQEAADPWDKPESKKLALRVTQKSIVLLKNEPFRGRAAADVTKSTPSPSLEPEGRRGALPLDRRRVRSIAVLGPRADEVLLDWYSGTPPYAIAPLQGIRDKVGPDVAVTYHAGDDLPAAAALANEAEVAIVVVGNHPTCNAGWLKWTLESEGKEGIDRKIITLEREDLIQAVYAANPNTVVVLQSSFPYAINWTQENVAAIVHMTTNSQETGSALADVLFGDFNPGGRLVQTWPKSLDDLPPILDYDIRNGRTYLYSRAEPLYPFGHGLTYTTFAYGNLRTSAGTVRGGGAIEVSVDVTNTGGRSGDEVVQMYVSHIDSEVIRPIKELKGFRRVTIAPGETATVTLPLAGQDLAYWDEGKPGWMVEDGRVRILIGSSSADIRQEAVVAVRRPEM
jgi:beta-glucosidase